MGRNFVFLLRILEKVVLLLCEIFCCNVDIFLQNSDFVKLSLGDNVKSSRKLATKTLFIGTGRYPSLLLKNLT